MRALADDPHSPFLTLNGVPRTIDLVVLDTTFCDPSARRFPPRVGHGSESGEPLHRGLSRRGL